MTPIIQSNPQQLAAVQLPEHVAVINDCRLAHAKIYEPGNDLSGRSRYSVTLLIPKTCDMTRIQAASRAAVVKGIKDKWNGMQPANLKLPIMDGDMYAAQKPEKRAAYVGMWYINAKQNPEFGKPVILNERRVRSNDKNEVQSGDYATVVVEFVPYTNATGNGVTVIPKTIRKTRTGDHFGGGLSETDALAALGGELTEEEAALIGIDGGADSGLSNLF